MEKEKRVLKCVSNDGVENRLTIGRYYPVEYTYVDDSFKLTGYHILDDYGCYSTYSTKYFVEGAPRSLSTVDPIVEQVKDFFDKRSEVGIKKYGTTLYENNKDNFLDHLREELHDAILYLTKLKNDEEKKFTDVLNDSISKSYSNLLPLEETAVKYIVDNVENGDIDDKFDWTLTKEKAKELFKQQVMYAFYVGKYSDKEFKSGEDFFNKTYQE